MCLIPSIDFTQLEYLDGALRLRTQASFGVVSDIHQGRLQRMGVRTVQKI